MENGDAQYASVKQRKRPTPRTQRRAQCKATCTRTEGDPAPVAPEVPARSGATPRWRHARREAQTLQHARASYLSYSVRAESSACIERQGSKACTPYCPTEDARRLRLRGETACIPCGTTSVRKGGTRASAGRLREQKPPGRRRQGGRGRPTKSGRRKNAARQPPAHLRALLPAAQRADAASKTRVLDTRGREDRP